jgi:hypothetical protein
MIVIPAQAGTQGVQGSALARVPGPRLRADDALRFSSGARLS